MLHAKYLIICVLPLTLVKASYEIWKIIVVSFEILLCIWEIGFCLWCFMQILMIVVINPQKFVLLETVETPNSECGSLDGCGKPHFGSISGYLMFSVLDY